MPIFERYLLRKLLLTLAAVTPVFLLIVVGRLFMRLLDRVADNAYPVDVLASLMALGTLDALVYLLPFSAMLAAMLVLRHCYHGGEIHAAFSLRIARGRIYAVLMYFGVPLALLLLYLAMEVIPQLHYQYKFIKERSKQHIGVQMIPQKQFMELPDGGVLFVEERAGEEVGGVFVADLEGEVVEIAPRGRQLESGGGEAAGEAVFELEDGRIYQREQGGGGFKLFTYDSHRIWLPQVEFDLSAEVAMMGYASLRREPGLVAASELQRRLAVPVSLLLLLLLVEPLSRLRPGRSEYWRLAAGIVIFVAYTNLISFSARMVADGRLPLYPGVWAAPLALLLGAGLWLLYRRASH